MLLGYFILLISCFGIKFVSEINRNPLRQILIVGVFVYLVVEIAVYQVNYFIVYPAKSTSAFIDYGFKQSLQYAINQSPKEIVFFVNGDEEYYATLKFYSLVLKNPENIPITLDDQFDPIAGRCYIVKRNDRVGSNSPLPFNEFESQYQLSPLEIMFKVDQPLAVFKARCYPQAQ
jgi:hypothetical protein